MAQQPAERRRFRDIAQTLDRGKRSRRQFPRRYSALVSKGMTTADELHDPFYPAGTSCYGFCLQLHQPWLHQTGINMDAVKLMVRSSRRRRRQAKRTIALDAQNSLFSAMHRTTTRSWQALSTRNRGGCHHQCRRFRPWCCQTCSEKYAARTLSTLRD